MIFAWLPTALLILAPMTLLVWFVLDGLWNRMSSEESESEMRARRIVAVGAAVVGLGLFVSAATYIRLEAPAGMPAADWVRDPGSEGTIT